MSTSGQPGSNEAQPARAEGPSETPQRDVVQKSKTRMGEILSGIGHAARSALPDRWGKRVRQAQNIGDAAAALADSESQRSREKRTPVFIGDTQLDLNAIYKTSSRHAAMTIPAPTPDGKPIPVRIIANDNTVQVVPSEGSFHFITYVLPEGKGRNIRNVLTADVRTVDRDGQRLEGFPHGGPLMDASIDFLDTHPGGPIHEFKAQWTPIIGRDNFDQYNQGIQEGLTPEQAAFRTWSGRRIALRHGFTHFKGVNPDGSGGLEAVFAR